MLKNKFNINKILLASLFFVSMFLITQNASALSTQINFSLIDSKNSTDVVTQYPVKLETKKEKKKVYTDKNGMVSVSLDLSKIDNTVNITVGRSNFELKDLNFDRLKLIYDLKFGKIVKVEGIDEHLYKLKYNKIPFKLPIYPTKFSDQIKYFFIILIMALLFSIKALFKRIGN